MRVRLPSLPALLPLALLAACAARVIDAPSLSPRAVETHQVPLPDDASEPQVAADPALLQTIAAIDDAAAQGHAGFEQLRATTEAAVAKAANAAPGSESWTVAQQQLSQLDAARGPVAHAAVELDALRNQPGNLSSGNRTAIAAATERVAALSQSEADAMARLLGGLRG